MTVEIIVLGYLIPGVVTCDGFCCAFCLDFGVLYKINSSGASSVTVGATSEYA